MSETSSNGFDRMIFERGNTTFGSNPYVENDTERLALEPSMAEARLRELVGGLDYRGILSLLNALPEIESQLQRKASTAYPQDMLEGRSLNNYAGLVDDLGYVPEVDQPIGYMVTLPNGQRVRPSLVFPTNVPAKNDVASHWVVRGGHSIHSPYSVTSRLYHYESINPAGSAGITQVLNRFPDFNEAMAAIQADLRNSGYEIMETEPRLSSPILRPETKL